jgi:hypothetical protein
MRRLDPPVYDFAKLSEPQLQALAKNLSAVEAVIDLSDVISELQAELRNLGWTRDHPQLRAWLRATGLGNRLDDLNTEDAFRRLTQWLREQKHLHQSNDRIAALEQKCGELEKYIHVIVDSMPSRQRQEICGQLPLLEFQEF